MNQQLTKKFVAGMAALGLTAGAFGAVGSVQADDDSSGNGRNGIVGAWEIAVVPVGGDGQPALPWAFLNGLVMSSDGTLVNTGPGARAGVGVWEKTGKRTYKLHVVHPIDWTVGGSFGSDHVYDIDVELRLSKDGRSASGSYDTDVRAIEIVESGDGFDVEYGDPVTEYSGVVEYDRIGIDRD